MVFKQKIVVFGLILIFAVPSAFAASIQIDFVASSGPGTMFDIEVSGTVLFDDTRPDLAPDDPLFSFYENAVVDANVTVNGQNFSMLGNQFNVGGVINWDEGVNSDFFNFSFQMLGDGIEALFGFDFVDRTGSWLSDDSLPSSVTLDQLSPYDPDEQINTGVWISPNLIDGASVNQFLLFDTLTMSPVPVPIPTGIWLFITSLGVFVRINHKNQYWQMKQ